MSCPQLLLKSLVTGTEHPRDSVLASCGSSTVPEISISAKVHLGSQFWKFQLKVNGTCFESLVGLPDGGTKEPVTGKQV